MKERLWPEQVATISVRWGRSDKLAGNPKVVGQAMLDNSMCDTSVSVVRLGQLQLYALSPKNDDCRQVVETAANA